jgi:hypothetical protein
MHFFKIKILIMYLHIKYIVLIFFFFFSFFLRVRHIQMKTLMKAIELDQTTCDEF